ncbi:MAG: hypothetical protein VXZ82_10505 [Planctomycetota bacterium]|nr:hypothetical protein [Planctomycetota bacterium]
MDRRWQDRRAEDKEELEQEELESESEELEGDEAEPSRKKQRRRQIDPTTCERDYNCEEIEFMRALDDYKRESGRMFPTCSEILEVVRALGYVQLTDEESQLLESIQQVEDEIAEGIEHANSATLLPSEQDQEQNSLVG